MAKCRNDHGVIERIVAERLGSLVGGAIGRGIVDAADAGVDDEAPPSTRAATRRVLALGVMLVLAVLVLALAAIRTSAEADMHEQEIGKA